MRHQKFSAVAGQPNKQKCGYCWKELKTGWVAWEWCEKHADLTGRGAKREEETWPQYFKRVRDDIDLPGAQYL